MLGSKLLHQSRKHGKGINLPPVQDQNSIFKFHYLPEGVYITVQMIDRIYIHHVSDVSRAGLFNLVFQGKPGHKWGHNRP